MLKLLLTMSAVFALSGCCELFGVCTSASVHTSITHPGQFASQNVTPGQPLQNDGSLAFR